MHGVGTTKGQRRLRREVQLPATAPGADHGRWTDATFIQEVWGAIFTWNPAHVTSIQIQAQNKVESYDFFIDDMYFIK